MSKGKVAAAYAAVFDAAVDYCSKLPEDNRPPQPADSEIDSATRRPHRALLAATLCHCRKDLMQGQARKLAREIETACVDYALESVRQTASLRSSLQSIYKHKVNDLMHNLYRNERLLDKVLELQREGRLNELPRMHPHELFPDHWKEIIDKKQNTESSLSNLPTVHLPDIVCKKCKGVNYYYHSMQTRSGDEPETIFLTCSNCGHKIKR